MVDSSRRWRLDAVPGGYALKDSSGRRVAYVYGQATKVEDARYVAEKLTLLPELLEQANRGGLLASRPDPGLPESMNRI